MGEAEDPELGEGEGGQRPVQPPGKLSLSVG